MLSMSRPFMTVMQKREILVIIPHSVPVSAILAALVKTKLMTWKQMQPSNVDCQGGSKPSPA